MRYIDRNLHMHVVEDRNYLVLKDIFYASVNT